MFEVLIYLFETYIHSESELSIDYESITNDLSNIGFPKKDIYKALYWLKNLSCDKKNVISNVNKFSKHISARIYTTEESLRINQDCHGFMIFLEQLEILTLDTREMIIEKIISLDMIDVRLEDFKWIVLIILFNVPGCEIIYKKLENLLFNFNNKIIH